MNTLLFANRNRKELLRDPLTLFFMVAFPLALLFLMSTIQRNIPIPLFEINKLAPGIASFGLTFISLFAALLIANDRESLLMARLLTSPMRAHSFILGYIAPLLVIAFLQTLICFGVSVPLGLRLNPAMFGVMLVSSVFYIALGLLAGTVLTAKQANTLCGAVLTNAAAWLSGIWFDVELVGSGFLAVCKALPFYNGVQAARLATLGDYRGMLPPLAVITGYAILLIGIAIWVFNHARKKGTL